MCICLVHLLVMLMTVALPLDQVAAPELGARLSFSSLPLAATTAAGLTGDATIEELLNQILITFRNDGDGDGWLLLFALQRR